jgi:hypothetical protein
VTRFALEDWHDTGPITAAPQPPINGTTCSAATVLEGVVRWPLCQERSNSRFGWKEEGRKASPYFNHVGSSRWVTVSVNVDRLGINCEQTNSSQNYGKLQSHRDRYGLNDDDFIAQIIRRVISQPEIFRPQGKKGWPSTFNSRVLATGVVDRHVRGASGAQGRGSPARVIDAVHSIPFSIPFSVLLRLIGTSPPLLRATPPATAPPPSHPPPEVGVKAAFHLCCALRAFDCTLLLWECGKM